MVFLVHTKENHNRYFFRLPLYAELSPAEIPCLDRSLESQPSDMVFLVHPKQNHNRYYIRLTLYAEL